MEVSGSPGKDRKTSVSVCTACTATRKHRCVRLWIPAGEKNRKISPLLSSRAFAPRQINSRCIQRETRRLFPFFKKTHCISDREENVSAVFVTTKKRLLSPPTPANISLIHHSQQAHGPAGLAVHVINSPPLRRFTQPAKMVVLSLKICVRQCNVVKTMQFEPSTAVYDACRIIRERVPEAQTGQGESGGGGAVV